MRDENKRFFVFFLFLFSLNLVINSQVVAQKDENGRIIVTNYLPIKSERAIPSPRHFPKGNSASRERIIETVRDRCAYYDLDYQLVNCLIEQESGFSEWVVSKKGAVGLMQLLPSTARRFGVSDLWDWEDNLEGGLKYLDYLIGYFKNNIPLALAGYNAGENAVTKYSNKIPPYRETVNYVFSILERYGKKELIEQAKLHLADISDYQGYLSTRRKPKYGKQYFYMYKNKSGNIIYSNTKPADGDSIRILFKSDE